MTDFDLTALFSLTDLQERDKGTLSPSGVRSFNQELKSLGLNYKPYASRVGPGLATLSSEIKRALDHDLLPDFLAVLSRLTNKRFDRAFIDVRIYPQGLELAPWDGGDWDGAELSVLVSLVLSIPPDDSLDTMTRMDLVGLFEESPWNPNIKKLGKKGRLNEKLNVDVLNQLMGAMDFEHFHPFVLNGFELEILIDGCSEKDYERLGRAAQGTAIQASRSTRKELSNVPDPITEENAETQIPVLIAGIANALGSSGLNPKKMLPGDSLYALMGFDDKLTKSLVLSLQMHFKVLAIIGGNRMVTIGNAIEFAKENVSNLQDEDPPTLTRSGKVRRQKPGLT